MSIISVEQEYEACSTIYDQEYSHGEYCHEQSFRWGFQEGVEFTEKEITNKDYNRGFDDAIEKAKQLIISYAGLSFPLRSCDNDLLKERYKYALQLAKKFEEKMQEKRNVPEFNAIVTSTP